jgi:hypothetical protein
MRLFVLAALALTAFAGIMTIGPTDANAVVCARGVARLRRGGWRSGRGVGGAAVVRRPVAAACRWDVVNVARVRRCV